MAYTRNPIPPSHSETARVLSSPLHFGVVWTVHWLRGGGGRFRCVSASG